MISYFSYHFFFLFGSPFYFFLISRGYLRMIL